MRVKTFGIACVAGVSVRFRSKERGARVKHHTKNRASNPNHPAPPSVSFFSSRSISCAAKTENPVPRAFFAPTPNGNARYAGYFWVNWGCHWGQRKKWPIADHRVSNNVPRSLYLDQFTADVTAAMFPCKFCEKLYFLDLSSHPCHVETNKEYE